MPIKMPEVHSGILINIQLILSLFAIAMHAAFGMRCTMVAGNTSYAAFHY